MARLNEASAAPSVDPLEILRRKYLRQNRDIARANSAASARIRNLENEVSRLLAENLGLREQSIQLKSEIGECRNQRIVNHVTETRTEIDTKLQEIGMLLAGLCKEPARAQRAPPSETQREKTSSARSPDQRNWRNMCTLSETMAGQDGRLPPILENKSYPRRTLEHEEIVANIPDVDFNSADSPDIGPPPVSQFVNEDPVKIDLPTHTGSHQEEATAIDPVLSINLEQRRRRKDILAAADQKRSDKFESTVVAAPREAVQSLKIGAKRKMSARDEEELKQFNVKPDTSPEEFIFNRRPVDDKTVKKAAVSTLAGTARVTRELAVARGVAREKRTTGLSSNVRKALGQKNANVDVTNSPKKPAKTDAADEVAATKAENIKKEAARDHPRTRRQEPVVMLPMDDHRVRKTDVLLESAHSEPETPATADLLSPLSSEPSTGRGGSRDTPPPADFGAGTEAHRPSRRARASVSYAEPNLRDKMRRPTKELVDAVTGEGKSHRLSVNHLEHDPPTTAIKIKPEPVTNDEWKSMPPASSVTLYATSPLVDKTSTKDMYSDAPIGHRRRRISSMHQDSDVEVPRSGSGSTISALLVGHRRVKQEPTDDLEPTDTIEKALSKLDIYEFNEDSPKRDMTRPRLSSRDDRPSVKTARRQSSASHEIGSTSDGGVSEHEGPHRPIATASSRRRQSTLGLGTSFTGFDDKEPTSETALKRSNSSAGLTETMDTTRSERVAGRRRSMMI